MNVTNECMKLSGYCGTIADSNTFMDVVLEQKMPGLIRANPELYPNVALRDFSFAVSRTAVTNRKLKVNVTDGKILGLDSAAHRYGDCGAPVLRHGNTSVTCSVIFRGLNATFFAMTKGDNVFGSRKRIWVRATARNISSTLEATALPRQPASVRGFNLDSFTMDMDYDHDLTLNQEREDAFLYHFRENVRQKLEALLGGQYRRILDQAVNTTPFPIE